MGLNYVWECIYQTGRKQTELIIATVGKMQGIRTLGTLLAEDVSTLLEPWACWPCSGLHIWRCNLQVRIHSTRAYSRTDRQGPQASWSISIHLACSSQWIRKLANPWEESICRTVYYYSTLWETFQIHTWHSGKAKPPDLMFNSAGHPWQCLKSETELLGVGVLAS